MVEQYQWFMIDLWLVAQPPTDWLGGHPRRDGWWRRAVHGGFMVGGTWGAKWIGFWDDNLNSWICGYPAVANIKIVWTVSVHRIRIAMIAGSYFAGKFGCKDQRNRHHFPACSWFPAGQDGLVPARNSTMNRRGSQLPADCDGQWWFITVNHG